MVDALRQNRAMIGPVLKFDFSREKFQVFDLTRSNGELLAIDLNNEKQFINYIFETMARNQCRVGVGRYDEDRVIYERSGLFANPKEARSLHLGIDLWVSAGEPVFAPLPGTVHSFQDNTHFGDYGPTIILAHNIFGVRFFTLYGHLSRESLNGLFVGKEIAKGERIATVGEYAVNGNWPSHLHFEIITDMLGKRGDFPGVAKIQERDLYLSLCPDPNLILGIPGLDHGV